jgi:type I restriction enzyme S subunit
MKEGWEIKKLGEIATFSQGVQVGLNQHLLEPKEGYVRFIRIVDYTQDTNDIRYVPDPGKKYFVNEDDIVMVRYGTPGLIGRGKAGVIANNLFKIKVERIDITNDYLTLFLSQDDIQHYLSTQGSATMPALNFGQLKIVEIKFPPLPEQQRIVSILDTCFAAIDQAKANAEQNLKNAKELFESYLQGVFEKKGDGWEEKTLEEVCEITSKLIDPRLLEFQDLIHVGAGNIESKTGKLSDLKTAKEENLISGKFQFDDSMILYSKIRPYLMKVVNCDFIGICSADIYPLKPLKIVISKEFLYNILLSQKFTEYAIQGSQRAGMPKVNREHLFRYNFQLPPIKEQKAITQKLDALREETLKLEAIYQKKLDDLEELKKSILQKAFSGDLPIRQAGLTGREVEV